jgi:hypothetical protein
VSVRPVLQRGFGSRLPVGVLALTLACAGLSPISAQEGYVFSVTGEWRVSSQPELPVLNGGAVSSTDSLLAPSGPVGGERIVLWFEQGRLSCRTRAEGSVECLERERKVCTAGEGLVVPLKPCLGDNPPRVVRLMSALMRAFGEDPSRYWPLLSRSPGDGIREAVLLSDDGMIRLDALLASVPHGRYQICVQALDPQEGRPGRSECDYFAWTGMPVRMRTTLDTGLVELKVESMWTQLSAWVLLVPPDEFPAIDAEFREAARLVNGWADLGERESRGALRAVLTHLHRIQRPSIPRDPTSGG